MNNVLRYYDSFFKQRIVEYYLENQSTSSLRFVTNLFQVSERHRTLERWYDQYNCTISLLEQRHRSGTPSI